MVISPKAYQQQSNDRGQKKADVDKQQLWLPNGSAPPDNSVDLAKLMKQRLDDQQEEQALSESQKAGLLTKLKKLDEEHAKNLPKKKPGYLPSFGYDHDESPRTRLGSMSSSISSKSGR